MSRGAAGDEAALRHLKEVLWPRAYFEQDGALLESIRGLEQNRPYVATYQSTNVLVRRDGHRQAVASHVSGVRQVE